MRRRDLLPATVIALALAASSAAQTPPPDNGSDDGMTPLGLQPGMTAGSYALSGFDTVNLFSGALNLRLPLVKVGGRGEATMTVQLAIEQQWGLKKNKNANPLCWPRFNWFRGLKPGYGPGTLHGFKEIKEVVPGSTEALTRYTFSGPDGTQLELRDAATDGTPLGAAGNGPRGTTFKTSDGSAATFESTTAIFDRNQAVLQTGTLHFADGLRYRIQDGLVSWIRDRNGNAITFQYEAVPHDPTIGPQVTQITDSLGRLISFTYGPTADTIGFKGFGGADREITVAYGPLTDRIVDQPSGSARSLSQLVPEVNWATPLALHNPNVVYSVTLPNNQQYTFQYNDYGELAEVVLPTGATFRYSYGPGDSATPSGYQQSDGTINRRLTEKAVYDAGGTPILRTIYGIPVGVGNDNENQSVEVSHIDTNANFNPGDDTTVSREVHYFYGRSSSTKSLDPLDYPVWRQGKEYQTETFAPNQSSALLTLTHTWSQRPPVTGCSGGSWCPNPGPDEPAVDPRITQTDTRLDDGKTSRQSFVYDLYNNRTDVYEYDFGPNSPGGLLRHTHTGYKTSSNYVDPGTGAHLRRLPTDVTVFDGSNTQKAKTTYTYDGGSLTNRSNLTGRVVPDSYGATFTTRGNVTEDRRWLNTTGNDLVVSRTYDIAGNVVQETDPKLGATQFEYTDRFGAPNGDARLNTSPAQITGLSTFAFRTRITNPASQSSYTQFDYYTGNPVDGEDVNSVVSSATYDDPLDRPTLLVAAAAVQGSPSAPLTERAETQFSYDDLGRVVTVQHDKDVTGDGALRSETLFDGLGRDTETRLYEGPSAWIGTCKAYDALSRLSGVTNPIHATAESCGSEWTTTDYDALGRPTRVETPDGSATISVHTGNVSTVTDPAGKARSTQTDALGRTTSVTEDPGGLAYLTGYAYDTLDNLTQVTQATLTQGTQQRSFVYDSVSRLLFATNPESGTISCTEGTLTQAASTCYSYDGNGNLVTRKDARGVVTSHGYDGLNRLLTRTYTTSGSPPAGYVATPNVTFTYDAGDQGSYPKGRLSSVTNSASRTDYPFYDALGRVRKSRQTTGGTQYNMSYAYDLAGNLTAQQYPSGRVVATHYDSAARVSWVGEGSAAYADSFTYAPHGGVEAVRLGNGRWESTQFNNRLQPKFMGLGTASGVWDIFGLQNGYGGTVNNGNVTTQVITVPGQTLTTSYGYDGVNRLTTGAETSTVGGSSWSQTYAYDRWGNRAVTNGRLHNVLTPNSLAAYNPSNNRIANAIYDAAGNITSDAIPRTFAYDGENRQATFGGLVAYTYDGQGKRVTSTVEGATSTFVHDAFGKLLAEYGGAGDNVTYYLTPDPLGTVRVVTDAAAVVKSRADYLPFGEQIPSSFGGRNGITGYATDSGLRQKFTGQERDPESGLDYFGARFLSPQQGRFTSPDPAFDMKASAADPRRWNRYAYVSNNPLRYVDPDGREQTTTMSGRLVMGGNDNQPAANQKAQDQAFLMLLGLTGATVAGFAAPSMVATLGPAAYNTAADPRNQQLAASVFEAVTNPGPSSGLAPGAGAVRNEIGALRESAVASLTGGTRVAKQVIVRGAGTTDLDVIGGAGQLISVGGPGKAANLGLFGQSLKVLTALADKLGVQAQVYLVKGTSEDVAKVARRWVGAANVFFFDEPKR